MALRERLEVRILSLGMSTAPPIREPGRLARWQKESHRLNKGDIGRRSEPPRFIKRFAQALLCGRSMYIIDDETHCALHLMDIDFEFVVQ